MEEQPQTLAAAFPNPPPFWQTFTPENLKQISELRSQQSGAGKQKHDPAKELPIRLLDLPAELRFLQPPELPTGATYRVFGDTYNLEDPLPSLEDWGVKSLYTPPETTTSQTKKYEDHAFILKRMAKSLLLNFLELVGIMSFNPVEYQEKIADLQTIFVNFHHLLNTYRPHQARESLILMMQSQLERSRKETQGIREMKFKVEGILEGLGQAKLADDEEEMVVEEKEAFVEEGRDAWEELERVFGEKKGQAVWSRPG